MSTSTHAARRRRPAGDQQRRRSATRRRRLLVFVLLAVAVALAIPLLPSMKDAAQELTLPLRHEDIVVQQSREKGLDPALVAGVIYAESKFVDGLTSHAGAHGLMQITPETARGIAQRTGGVNFRQEDLSDPQINISYGTWYLAHMLDRYGDNAVLALAAYNAGQGNVDRWIVEAREGGRDFRVADIPFAETRAYVDRVLDAREDYRRAYADELGL